MIELWVPEICGATIQWQESSQASEDWQDLPEATGNSHWIKGSPATIEEKKFRAAVILPPATTAEYSYEFSIWLLDSLEELQTGQYYDGVFIYENRADTLLGSIFTEQEAFFGCVEQEIPGAGIRAIGGGLRNTAALIEQCSEPGSVGTILDTLSLLGYSDWFLPSIEGLKAALRGYVESEITQVAEVNRTHVFLSSTQWAGRPSERISVSRTRNVTDYNFRKDWRARVLAARRLTGNDPVSHRCQTLWPKYQFADLLRVGNTPEGSANVIIEYLGEDLLGSSYEWAFPEQMELRSGEGRGPYTLSNNFGGYQQFSLRIRNVGCHPMELQHPYFNINQARDIEAPFPESHRGHMAWGDYDEDGLKDVLITGTDTTALYRNLGANQFAWQATFLPVLSYSFADWGDMDNDGDLDLALMGLLEDGIPYSRVFLNEGEMGFQETAHSLPGIFNGFIKWIDHNMDGTLELLLSGETATGAPFTGLYRLGRSGQLAELPSTLPALKNSSVEIGDYDRNNYPDLILMGHDGRERITQVLRNDEGVFSALPLSITGLDHGAAIWTDYNNDGLLDFVIAGNKDSLQFPNYPLQTSVVAGQAGWLTLYANNGEGSFVEIGNEFFTASLDPIFSYAGLGVGDYDNDGDDDLVICGIPAISWTSSGTGGGIDRLIYRSIAQLMRNDNDLGFLGIEPNIPSDWSRPFFDHVPLSNFECSTIGFVDTDGDQQLDIFRGGRSYSTAAVYEWSGSQLNEPPSKPLRLEAEVSCDSVLLRWEAAMDDHTQRSSLSYSLYLRHTDSSNMVFSVGNDEVLRTTHFGIGHLAPGTYQWGVQATDRAKSESGFQSGSAFTIDAPLAPTLMRAADTLFSSSPEGNQWYDETGPITGATAPFFVVPVSGSYYCIVSLEGCSSPSSEVVDFLLTGVGAPSAAMELEVWPNPVDKIIHLKAANGHRFMSYEIYNAQGQKVLAGQVGTDHRIEIGDLPSGVYFLVLSGNEGLIYRRVIKR